MKIDKAVLAPSLAGIVFLLSFCSPHRASAQSVIFVTNSAVDVVYSEVTGLVYASTTNAGTLTPINPVDGSIGTPFSVPNLTGQLCMGDGGQYIFAAMTSGTTNHICQVDVNAQTVVTNWTLDGNFVDDMAPVLGSPGSVMVSRKVLGGSPRFRGVAVYDYGIARSNAFSPFLGPDRVEASRTTNVFYGYNNESSPASSFVLKLDASGVSQTGGWGTLQGFGVDIAWRAGWIFATNGQIFEPDRGILTGNFTNGPVADDPASGRYYIVSINAITAYDQNTLLPIGTNSLPGVSVFSAGNAVRCGTNGFAMRMSSTRVALIKTPLQSSGPAADLIVSVTSSNQPVPTNSQMTYTLTISNQGPNTAQNVVLTQTMPGNSSFASVSSSSGTNTLTGGGLVSLPMVIAPNNAVTVTVKLQTLKPGILASVASITSDSLDPNLSNNVVRLENSVGTTPLTNTVTEVLLQTTDIAWDRVSGRIFANIPAANLMLGNSIAALDPSTGIFEPRIKTTNETAKLVVSDNGQYLYAAIGSDSSIQRVNIPARTLDIKFPTGFTGVNDMAVMPGFPQTLLAIVPKTLAVYDDGVARPNKMGESFLNSVGYLALSDDNAVAYEGARFELRGISINASGAAQSFSSFLTVINDTDFQIKYGAGRLFTTGGRVIDPVALTVLTNFPFSGLVYPDARQGKVFYLTVSGSTGTLHAVNINTLVDTGTATVTNISGSVSSLIRWGTDGLAFRTSGNQLFLVRTSLADDDTNHDGISDYWEMANFGTLSVNLSDDPDHDGMSNEAEYLAGTGPNSSGSALRLMQITSGVGSVGLNWQAGTNVTYYLQRSPGLTGPLWQNVLTNPPSTSGSGSYTDLTATNGVNYYRIKVGN